MDLNPRCTWTCLMIALIVLPAMVGIVFSGDTDDDKKIIVFGYDTQLADKIPQRMEVYKESPFQGMVIGARLPRDFDYHRIPAPWIQMLLLRILAVLGEADQSASEGMYEVLLDVMRRADTGISVGYAIIYECVRTVTTIYPNSTLLDAAAASIARFIASDNHNLKYLGVDGPCRDRKGPPQVRRRPSDGCNRLLGGS